MIASSAIISDHSSVVPAIERTSSKPIAGIFGLPVDIRLEADAAIGRGEILGRDRDDAAAIADRDAGADGGGVDAGDGAPIGLDAALAGDARDLVPERRDHRHEELGAGLEVVIGEARRSRLEAWVKVLVLASSPAKPASTDR